jgi:hypothetical protein
MATSRVRESARDFNPNPQHAPQQASDLLALVVVALVIANVVLLIVLSS